MHVSKKIGIAAGALAVAAMSIASAAPAGADTAAQTGDAVIVGSDTVQNAINFALDGTSGVVGGYNTTGNAHRALNFDANGDANGRGVYDGTCTYTTTVGSTTTTQKALCGDKALTAAADTVTPNLLGSSAILRAGTNPVIRPNGSGAGVGALIADSGTGGYEGLPDGSIQIARMSRLPKASEEASCPTDGPCGGLHVYQIADDDLTIAHQAGTGNYNGPASLSAQQLIAIYTCKDTTWGQVTGDSSNTEPVHPLIPQASSGTASFFLADLATANGGTPVTPGSCVRTVQEHDPSGIYTDTKPADAIEPFSAGKLALLNSGYFATGATGSPNAAAFAKGYLTTTASGTASDGNKNYRTTRGLFLVVRQPDVTSTTAFQPGGTQNFVDELITGQNSALQSAVGQAAIRAAGFTPDYIDCGVNPSGCTGS